MIYLASTFALIGISLAIYSERRYRKSKAHLTRAMLVYEASVAARESAALAYLLASEITRANAQLAPVTVRGNAIGEPS